MEPSTVQRGFKNEPIALIGSACRFAGNSKTPAKFWDLIHHPRDVLCAIPPERFSPDGFYHPDHRYQGHSNVEHAYLFSDDIRQFDASFFGIKPVEASATDPQQRLLLEVVYEAIQAAGLPMYKLRGSKTAVYVGLMCGDYDTMISRDTEAIPAYHATGTARSMMSNRVSHFFDWRGPSMTIDTACSSSLVAVHQAVQSLRAGESSLAVVAGSNLILGPEQFIAESKLRMLSPDGRSRMWDASANGYARGEGIAAVVLKPLSVALRDKDLIECLIVESGVNQDGHTNGITVPSAAAQADLIQETYSKAGLDPRSKHGRPQYFEAHGTGTPAGDPIEAQAIHHAFYGSEEQDGRNRLYVGSVKTIIGHTEGTAGLAGLLKASLAIQHGIIPPNMHFKKLNPSIQEYYSHLEVPTDIKQWPTVGSNAPRRASVNSFGFGGTNAHVILESFSMPTVRPPAMNQPFTLPFVFSAHSASSLRATLQSYSYFLRENTSTDLRNLAFTLYSRRSHLPYKTAIAASSMPDLLSQLDERQAVDTGTIPPIPTKRGTQPSSLRVLGIFTGQGAQWAGMGRRLLEQSAFVRASMVQYDLWLAELPVDHRPGWSLQLELLKPDSLSRVNEAELSQPVCTVIQIILIKILRSAGIGFRAVVGHSSGEIAAAYAAARVSEREALYIAYYRGFYTHLAHGIQEQRGKMLACGTTYEDARELCELPFFRARLSIAAHNSSSSVTLSGDESRVDQAALVCQDEKKFSRLLRVDKAYHSHHMHPCSKPYADALGPLIESSKNYDSGGEQNTRWYSSVTGANINFSNLSLKSEYWVQNMNLPVQFHSALIACCTSEGDFDYVIELGPHPALQAPALQTIQECYGGAIPYTGLLRRGSDDVKELALGLANIWTSYPDTIDLSAFDRLSTNTDTFEMVNNLPTYPWDHEKVHWRESRQSRAFRSRGLVHDLLGHLTPESSSQLYRWRHTLNVAQASWLEGHKLQGQIVFPAAGYIVTALEAALAISKDRNATAVEIRDLEITQAMTFDQNETNMEILFTVSGLSVSDKSISASFIYEAATGKSMNDFALFAKGTMSILTPKMQDSLMAPRSSPEPHLVAVEKDKFYDHLLSVGYGYTGSFRALTGLQRKLGWATGFIDQSQEKLDLNDISTVQPATLDAAIQAVILAHCYPEDGTLWSLHIPRSIECVTFDVLNWDPASKNFDFDCVATHHKLAGLLGDVEIFDHVTSTPLVKMEGIKCTPFSVATQKDDRKLFSYEKWCPVSPDANSASAGRQATQEDYDFAVALERVAFYFMRQIETQVSQEHPARRTQPFSWYFAFIQDVLSSAPDDHHPFIQTEWRMDGHDEIAQLMKTYEERPDMQAIRTVGEHIIPVMHGETTILEHLMKDDLLYRYYSEGMGFAEHSTYLAKLISQITHRYPHMRCLEIGGGTGAATRHILRETRATFDYYAFTDVSKGFFDKARKQFEQFHSRMSFHTLDIELDPVHQDFEPSSFDLIVASNVIHATKTISKTLANIRKLLKPGGYLAIMEITSNAPIRSGFVFGTLPGWWLGVDDSRLLSPLITPQQWDFALRSTGFSGIDTITPQTHTLPFPGSALISQAVDDRISLLRQPSLAQVEDLIDFGKTVDRLILIGGLTERTRNLCEDLHKWMHPYFNQIVCISNTSEYAALDHETKTAVVSITELDRPLFKDITAEEFDGFKNIFDTSEIVVWVTKDRLVGVPYSNMAIGFGRSQVLESPNTKPKYINFTTDNIAAEDIAEHFWRHMAECKWRSNLYEKCLWSVEREIEISDSGTHLRRLVENEAFNRRYNSARRPINLNNDSKKQRIRLVGEGDTYLIESVRPLPGSMECPEELTEVSLVYSSFSALPFRDFSRLYLGYATSDDAGYFILLNERTHTAQLPTSSLVPCTLPVEKVPSIIFLVMCHLVTDLVLPENHVGSVIILDASKTLGEILLRKATQRGVDLRLVTSSRQVPGPGWISVSPHTPRRHVKELVSGDVSVFVSFAATYEGHRTSNLLRAELPSHCRNTSADLLLANQATLQKPSTQLFGALKSAIDVARSAETTCQHVAPLTIDTIIGANTHPERFTIVQWSTISTSQLRVRAVDAEPIFKTHRTYWLVGLTQSLGLSLCDWMISKGARNIVLSSRSPKIDQRWLKKTRQLGVTIKIFSNDVSDMNALRDLHGEICRTMPPIAGVAQGAMVLKDVLARNMSLKDFLTVTNPKVLGSNNLDSLFSENTLDFFLLFSSMALVVGNLGQCNYTAANAYLTSLAANRRQRGLSASVINIGAILGAGYVTQQLDTIFWRKLQEGGHTWMSERDFHQIFAEGVYSSALDDTDNWNISTGLKYVSNSDSMKPHWHDDPSFSHQLLGDDTETPLTGTKSKTRLAISTQISQASSLAEIAKIVQENFLAKLRSSLQIEEEAELKTSDILGKGMDSLGIDSLIAVDLRTWFLKNLSVNIPVLKILGGVTVMELIEYATSLINSALAENGNTEHQQDSTSTTQNATPSSTTDSGQQSSTKVSEIGHSTGEDEVSRSSSLDTSKNDEDHEPDHFLVRKEFDEKTLDISVHDISRLRSKKRNATDPISTTWSRKQLKRIQGENRIIKNAPLSHTQSMFWFSGMYMDNRAGVNHAGVYRINGNIRTDDLRRAVNIVAQRHEILRTAFIQQQGGVIEQAVMTSSSLMLECDVIQHVEQVWACLKGAQSTIFDLEKACTMRIKLLTHFSSEHYLVMACHPVVMDGLSHQIFMAELERAYDRREGPPAFQFSDHAVKERLPSNFWERQIDYWSRVLASLPAPLDLFPIAGRKVRSSLKEHVISRAISRINPDVNSGIRQFCSRARVTPFQFHFAVFRVLLYRLTSQVTICIGTADANRSKMTHLDTAAIGPYVNLLPICVDCHNETSFKQIIRDTKTKVLEALAHSEVPFEVLLHKLKVPRSSSHTPLFQCFIDYRQGAKEKQQFGNCELEALAFDTGTNGYDFSIDIIDQAGGECLLTFMTQKELYGQQEVELLASCYMNVLHSCLEHSQLPLGAIDIFSAEAREAALFLGSGTMQESNWAPTIVHRVDEMIGTFPHESAMIDYAGNSFTYAQMAKKVAVIASALVHYGVMEGEAVGVYQQPTSDTVCSLLAILRLGAVYVPLDVDLPVNRLTTFASDSRLRVVLVAKETVAQAGFLCATLGSENSLINISEVDNMGLDSPQIIAKSDAPAIVLFTSGSTGNPKSVSLSHSNIVNDIEMSGEAYQLSRETVLLQSSFGFDMSLTQIFLALAYGGSLVIASYHARKDPQAIVRAIHSRGITLTAATPSEYFNWLNCGELRSLENSAWKLAISGGEAVSSRLLNLLKQLGKQDLSFYNAYGPTETTCCATRVHVPLQASVSEPISAGYPVRNASVYILDGQLKPVPIGVSGEIFIGGAGVALGYLDQAKNAPAFLGNPWSSSAFQKKGWNKMYRTGDLGRWSGSGSLLLEGRVADDTEVKLRGLRINLHEIEESILTTAGGKILEVIVIIQHTAEDAHGILVAYVVVAPHLAHEGIDGLSRTIKANLPLPQYMHPAVFLPILELPKTSSGKLDRRALSALELPRQTREGNTASFTDTEAIVAELWRDVLNPIPLGVIEQDTDFFAIGGSSILLVSLQRFIRSRLGCDVALHLLFEHSTIRAMAVMVNMQLSTDFSSLSSSFDWDQESALLSDHENMDLPRKLVLTGSDYLSVILTGATGYLGKELLHRLVEAPRVRVVHCLATRNPDAIGSLLGHPKVMIYPGDLRDPTFTLSSTSLSELVQDANVVIHNGADVSHLKSYESLKHSNLLSTKRLMNLCRPRRIPFHFISTAGVVLLSGLPQFDEDSVAGYPPPLDGSDGYTASKWCSENFLEKAATHYEVPVWIHRPSSILRESDPGQDILQNLLQYMKVTGYMPHLQFLDGAFDVVYLSTVAHGILSHLNVDPGPGMKYVHHSGDIQVPFERLQHFLEDQEHFSLVATDLDDWVTRAEEAGMSSLVGAVLRKMAAGKDRVVFPKLLKHVN